MRMRMRMTMTMTMWLWRLLWLCCAVSRSDVFQLTISSDKLGTSRNTDSTGNSLRTSQ